MTELAWLADISFRLWIMGILIEVIVAVEVVRLVIEVSSNRNLRSLNRAIKSHPEIQFQSRLAAAEKRVAR